MGAKHGFFRPQMGRGFPPGASQGGRPPSGSAYHLDFRKNTAWQGAILLGTVSNLLSGTLRLSASGLEVQDGDDYAFDADILTLVQTDTGSVVVTGLGPIGSARIIGGTGTRYLLLKDDTNTIAAWNTSNVLTADAGSGDFDGSFKIAAGFTETPGNARSLVFNNGTVTTDANSANGSDYTGLWLGGDGGSNGYATGFYHSVTWYASKLSDVALKALTA